MGEVGAASGGGGGSGEAEKRFLYEKAGGMIGTGKRIDGILERIPLKRRESVSMACRKGYH